MRRWRKQLVGLQVALFLGALLLSTVAMFLFGSSEEQGVAPPGDERTGRRMLLSSGSDSSDFPPDLFTREQKRNGAVLLHIFAAVYMFVGLAIVCDDYFVASLEVITEKLQLSDDVAGATFMAAGGSAPELFTSLLGVFVAKSDVGFGTIVGSAVFNVLFVISMCVVFAGQPLHLTWWPLARDSFVYGISLIVLVAFVATGREIKWWEAAILFSMYFMYVAIMVYNETLERLVASCFCSASPRRGGATVTRVRSIHDSKSSSSGTAARLVEGTGTSSTPKAKSGGSHSALTVASVTSEDAQRQRRESVRMLRYSLGFLRTRPGLKAAMRRMLVKEAALRGKKRFQSVGRAVVQSIHEHRHERRSGPGSGLHVTATTVQSQGPQHVKVISTSSVRVRRSSRNDARDYDELPAPGRRVMVELETLPPHEDVAPPARVFSLYGGMSNGQIDPPDIDESLPGSVSPREPMVVESVSSRPTNKKWHPQRVTVRSVVSQAVVVEPVLAQWPRNSVATTVTTGSQKSIPAGRMADVADAVLRAQGKASVVELQAKARLQRDAQKKKRVHMTSQYFAEDAAEAEVDGMQEEADSSPLALPTDGSFKAWLWYLYKLPLVTLLFITVPDCRQSEKRHLFPLTFMLSMAWIAGYSYLMVWMAQEIGTTFNIPDTIMGITVLAAGTSVPDALSSVIVARQGLGDMAVSSSIGSNIFDVLVGLPLPWLIKTVLVEPGSTVPIFSETLEIQVATLFIMLLATILTIILKDWVLDSSMGGVLLCLYVIFVTEVLLLEGGVIDV